MMRGWRQNDDRWQIKASCGYMGWKSICVSCHAMHRGPKITRAECLLWWITSLKQLSRYCKLIFIPLHNEWKQFVAWEIGKKHSKIKTRLVCFWRVVSCDEKYIYSVATARWNFSPLLPEKLKSFYDIRERCSVVCDGQEKGSSNISQSQIKISSCEIVSGTYIH